MTVQSRVDTELNLESLLEVLGCCAEIRASDVDLPWVLGRVTVPVGHAVE